MRELFFILAVVFLLAAIVLGVWLWTRRDLDDAPASRLRNGMGDRAGDGAPGGPGGVGAPAGRGGRRRSGGVLSLKTPAASGGGGGGGGGVGGGGGGELSPADEARDERRDEPSETPMQDDDTAPGPRVRPHTETDEHEVADPPTSEPEDCTRDREPDEKDAREGEELTPRIPASDPTVASTAGGGGGGGGGAASLTTPPRPGDATPAKTPNPANDRETRPAEVRHETETGSHSTTGPAVNVTIHNAPSASATSSADGDAKADVSAAGSGGGGGGGGGGHSSGGAGPSPSTAGPPHGSGRQPGFGDNFRLYDCGSQDEAAKFFNVSYCCFDFETKDGVKLRGRWYCDTVALDCETWPSAFVCLHDFVQNERDFARFAARAAKELKRPVITVSQRGRGRSDFDPRPERYTNPTYRDDTIALLHTLYAYAVHNKHPEAECYRRYTWLGVGMGGLVTLWAANEHDGLDLMDRVILNDVGPELAPEGLEHLGRRQGSLAAGPITGIDPVDHPMEALRWLRAVYPGVRERDDKAFVERVKPRILRMNSNGHWAADFDFNIADQFLRDQRVVGSVRGELTPAQDARRWEQWGRLGAIPTLVLHGGASDLLSSLGVEKMIRARPTAQTRTFGDVAHAPDVDDEPVWERIAKFLGG